MALEVKMVPEAPLPNIGDSMRLSMRLKSLFSSSVSETFSLLGSGNQSASKVMAELFAPFRGDASCMANATIFFASFLGSSSADSSLSLSPEILATLNGLCAKSARVSKNARIAAIIRSRVFGTILSALLEAGIAQNRHDIETSSKVADVCALD